MSSKLNQYLNTKNVALSRNYDLDVNPQDYEAYVLSVAKRGNLATSLAELAASYISPSKDSGEQAEVLDVAAGTGIISRVLVDRGYNVTATDLSQKALDYLLEKSQQVATKQADMNKGLPFQDSSFDMITSVWGNRFIKNSDKFLQETHRVLKTGGVLIWPIFQTERPLWKKENGLKQHTTPKSLMKDATAVGFNKVEVVKSSKVDSNRQGIPFHSAPSYIVAKK